MPAVTSGTEDEIGSGSPPSQIEPRPGRRVSFPRRWAWHPTSPRGRADDGGLRRRPPDALARLCMSQPPAKLIPALDRYRQGDLAGARRAAEAALSEEPGNVELHAFAGLVAAQAGDEPGAIPHFRAVLAALPGDIATPPTWRPRWFRPERWTRREWWRKPGARSRGCCACSPTSIRSRAGPTRLPTSTGSWSPPIPAISKAGTISAICSPPPAMPTPRSRRSAMRSRSGPIFSRWC